MSEPDLSWVEAIPEDVEASLPPAVQAVLKAMRQLHREEGD